MPSCHHSRHVDFCQSERREERIRPCQIVVEDKSRRNENFHPRVEFQLVRPFCCYADAHQIIIIMACAALVYSIAALVLTCINAPHPFFIPVLSYSIFTMIVVLGATLSGKNAVLTFAFVLTIILAILATAGAIYCVIYLIHNFHASFEWKWRCYMITMMAAQTLMIFYVIALICLIAEIITFNRRLRAQAEQRAQRIPVWRRY